MTLETLGGHFCIDWLNRPCISRDETMEARMSGWWRVRE
jgi:hypothetical protein